MGETLLICIISSASAAALVSAIKELIIWKLNRKAKLDDDKSAENKNEIISKIESQQTAINTLTSKIEEVKKQISATMEHDKIILHDKIRYLISKYIEYGEITLDERQYIHHMWSIYHHGLGGNGDLDDWMQILDEIPLKDGVSI